MPKRGQHKNDARDQRVSPGPNNPSKSVTITTGSPKKQETYEEQARQGQDPYKPAQAATREWRPDSRDPSRSGPDTPRGRKGDLSEGDETLREPNRLRGAGSDVPEPDWRQDLNPNAQAGQNRGPETDAAEKGLSTLYDLKHLHRRYSGLADDDLKQVPVLERGMRLQQGATYFDLNDVDRGEFTATGDMAAGPENAYVPKSEVDYDLWNRLIGVREPARTPGR
jgi:hypothetical protein